MAFNGKSGSNCGATATGMTSALQVRRTSALSGATPAFGPALPGTGFETLPPLAISSNLFKFLKCLGLESVGLSLDCVPFHAGWELVVWKPYLSMSEWIEFEFEKIYDKIEAEDSIEVVELPVEVPGVVPTVVVKEEEDSSVDKKEEDQMEGTGAEPVPETAEIGLRDQFERTVEGTVYDVEEPRTGAELVHEHDRSGEEPDVMEVD